MLLQWSLWCVGLIPHASCFRAEAITPLCTARWPLMAHGWDPLGGWTHLEGRGLAQGFVSWSIWRYKSLPLALIWDSSEGHTCCRAHSRISWPLLWLLYSLTSPPAPFSSLQSLICVDLESTYSPRAPNVCFWVNMTCKSLYTQGTVWDHPWKPCQHYASFQSLYILQKESNYSREFWVTWSITKINSKNLIYLFLYFSQVWENQKVYCWNSEVKFQIEGIVSTTMLVLSVDRFQGIRTQRISFVYL